MRSSPVTLSKVAFFEAFPLFVTSIMKFCQINLRIFHQPDHSDKLGQPLVPLLKAVQGPNLTIGDGYYSQANKTLKILIIYFYPEAEGEDHICKKLVRFDQTLLVRILRVVTVDFGRLSCLHYFRTIRIILFIPRT